MTKQSKYFLKTSKNASKDDKIISSRLLKQAGFIKESVAGRYYFLPIGHRVQQKIMEIVKDEMDKAGAQEMVSPILHPLELWKETNRTKTTGFELMKVHDRRDAQFALGGTAEEMFVDLVRKFSISYRDLPFHLYQFSPKFRDERRARGGLLRVREFFMKDGYSFHADEKDFAKEYKKMQEVYTRIFERVGLKTTIVESDNGYIGGEYSHEFVVESPIGESRYLVTESGYAAHEDVAKSLKEEKNLDEPLKEIKKIDAKRGNTMEDGVKFHKLPLWQQIKDVLYVDQDNRFVLAIIRGDFDVNEAKLKHVSNSATLRHATDEEIRNVLNSEPGFISPVDLKKNFKKGVELIIVADDSLRTVKNVYGGANAKHKDLLNVNIDRDYKPDIEADIALSKAGHKSLSGETLAEKTGIEVGNVFQLGYHYTKLMKGAVFTDADGKEKPYYMGCYGIGIGRTMAAIAEVSNDENGIIWPQSVSPFAVHLLNIAKDPSEANKIYETLQSSGIEVLYDDRDESAGSKFADADLIGISLRVLVSDKTLKEDSVEIRPRNEKSSKLVKIKDLKKLLQK